MRPGPRVAIATQGCRVNFHDSDGLLGRARAAGFEPVPFDREAELYVVNSCTVTAAADAGARKLARAARRRTPGARVVVVGCSGEVGPEVYRAMPEVDLVLGTAEKARLFEVLAAIQAGERAWGAPSPPAREARILEDPGPVSPSSRARPVVKVQDGCNHRCSFCVIPRARGPSRSLALEAVRDQLAGYRDLGVAEVVLSGVHLASWGRDLRPKQDLESLLRACAAVPGVPRMRLSSIEPVDMSEGVVELLASRGDVFARFLHMAVQSGSTPVLQRMKRRYTAEDFLERARGVLRRMPGIGLGLDLLVGFPGESEADFEATVALVEALPVLKAHVFPYSERPETAALELEDPVPVPERRRRGAQLREVATRVRRRVLEGWVGEELPAVAVGGGEAGHTRDVVTDVGAELRLAEEVPRGAALRVRVAGLEGEVLRGDVVARALAV